MTDNLDDFELNYLTRSATGVSEPKANGGWPGSRGSPMDGVCAAGSASSPVTMVRVATGDCIWADSVTIPTT